jgi:hypothetical protein
MEPAEPDWDQLLSVLERRRETLEAELRRVRADLMKLRTADTLCPRCLGSGQRRVRGGLYGEIQLWPCRCSTSSRS